MKRAISMKDRLRSSVAAAGKGNGEWL